MNKRWIAALMAVLLLAAVLGGCAGGETVKLDPKNPVTIDIWHYYNGTQKAAFDLLVDEFNETVGMQQGIIVEAYNQGDVAQLIESVLASANNKVGTEPIPNIFAGYADTVYQVDKLGLVANLEDYLTAEEIAEYVPSYIAEGRLGADDALKIFPTAKSTEIFMLNRTDWEPFAAAAGVSLDELSTIEGLIEVSKKYYEYTDALTPDVPDDGKAFFGRDAMANYMIIGCKQLGVEIFSVKNGEVSFQLDREVLRKLWDCYYVPYIHGYFAAYGRFRSNDAKIGDILALVGSTTSATYFPTEIVTDERTYPIEAVVLQAPVFEGGEPYAVQQGAGMVVSKSTPEEEYASVQFLKWFTETERNLEFSVLSAYLPVKSEANNMNRLEKVLDAADPTDITDTLRETFRVSFQTAIDHTLYTNQAFEGGTDARNVLEFCLSDRATADKTAIDELIAAGTSREEAIARYNTDESFEAWLADLEEKLNETQKG